MSQDFFNGLKSGFELGARFKYLQIHLLTLMKDFEKINQKSKQHYLYDLWTKVIECQNNIEELWYQDDSDQTSKLDTLTNLCCQFNEHRQKYRVLLEQYNEIKKSRPAKTTRKRKCPVVVNVEDENNEEEF